MQKDLLQPAGAFTIQATLALTPEHRRRLEHAVRSGGLNPSEVISAIVASGDLPLPDRAAAGTRVAQLPARIYLTPDRREALADFVHAHELSLAEVLSELLAHHLAELPDPPPVAVPRPDRSREIRTYRRELSRLRAQREKLQEQAPRWLDEYILDMEEEIQRMERQ
jgi:hypothetical protein